MEAVLRDESTKEVTLTLPAELNDQIREKATVFGADFDKMVAVLLRYGLAVQNEREREIARLTDQIVLSNEQEAVAASDRLGKMIFDK
jgi:hypothetical protein